MKLKSRAVMWAHGFVVAMLAFALPSATLAFPSSSEDDSFTLVYVPGVSGGITEINSANDVVFGTAPWVHGSNGGIAITRDGSRMYVSNHETSAFPYLTRRPM
jgi:DNA-binding beta-propeller fold protein YncE